MAESIKYVRVGEEEHPLDANFLEGKTSSNFVDTSSSQEIEGVKEFKDAVTFSTDEKFITIDGNEILGDGDITVLGDNIYLLTGDTGKIYYGETSDEHEVAIKGDIPTSTSTLTNDSGYITNAVNNLTNYYLKSQTYTKNEVDELIETIKQFEVVVADELPSASEETKGKMYLIPNDSDNSGNVKDEFITLQNNEVYSWEKIGSTEISLDGYATEDYVNGEVETINQTIEENEEVTATALTDLDSRVTTVENSIGNHTHGGSQVIYDGTLIPEFVGRNMTEGIEYLTAYKQDTLVSGTSIKTINGESILGKGNIIISGGGGGVTYTAGTNIDITNNVISVTGITVPTKTSDLTNDNGFLTEHQDIKTINGSTITGAGNISVGTVTSVSTGNGITGGPITTTGELGLDTRIKGVQTTYSVSNISPSYRETHAIIQDSGILSFVSQPEEGYPVEIYIDHQASGDYNELENIIVTLPSGGNYKCVCPSTVTILEGEYARVTARTFDGVTYIDAQTFYYIDTPSIDSMNVGDEIDDVIMRYNGWILGYNGSTASTTEIGEAITNDIYHFNLICSTAGRVKIQSVNNTRYYLGNNGNWSTTAYEWYWDGTHLANTNKTDGSGRLYMSSATAFTVGKTNAGAWIISQPKKKAK